MRTCVSLFALCGVPGLIWLCAEACEAVSGFEVTLTGGDGNDVQLCMSGNPGRYVLLTGDADYVGYWPSQNSVVVAHEGTDPTQLYAPIACLFAPLPDIISHP